MFLIILLDGNTLACSQLAESVGRLLELEKDANDTRPSTTVLYRKSAIAGTPERTRKLQ
jgi:hypothetical protein